METQYLIPASLLKDVLDYLNTRPYREVGAAMPLLHNLPVANAPTMGPEEGGAG